MTGVELSERRLGQPEEIHGHRTVVLAKALDGGKCTLVAARMSEGFYVRVMLSFHGVRQATALLRKTEVDDLIAALQEARGVDQP